MSVRTAAWGVAAALLGASVCLAQTDMILTVNSGGYVKVDVAPGAIETVSAPMTPFAVDSGKITGIGAASLTDTAKDWSGTNLGPGSEGYLAYLCEIRDGAHEGRYFPILSNTANTLALEAPQDLTTLGLIGASYSIRPFLTVQELFADADGSPLLSGGANPAAASNILAWNGDAFDLLYFSTLFGENTWRQAGGTTANEWPIYPDEGLMVVNRGTDAVEIENLGEVADNAKACWVPQGLTLTCNPFPASVTLATAGLLEADGGPLAGGSSAAAADQVLLWNGDTYDFYYYSTFMGENLWRRASGGLAGDTPLEAGRAFFLQNAQGGAGVWSRRLPY